VFTQSASTPFSLGEKVSREARRMRAGAKRRRLKRIRLFAALETTAAETLIRPRLRRVHLLPEGEGSGGAAFFMPLRTVR
jgi:hypothetical protein